MSSTWSRHLVEGNRGAAIFGQLLSLIKYVGCKFIVHNHKMAASRVYMAVSKQIPENAVRVEVRKSTAVVHTQSGDAQVMDLTPNRACFVRGDRCAATRVDLLGPPPEQIERAKARCNELLGPSFFERETCHLIPDRAVVEEAERIILQAIQPIRSSWERTKIWVSGADSAGRTVAPQTPHAGPAKADPPTLLDKTRPIPVKEAASPKPVRRKENTELLRQKMAIDKKISALQERRAKVAKTSNRIVRARLLSSVDKQIGEATAQRDALEEGGLERDANKKI